VAGWCCGVVKKTVNSIKEFWVYAGPVSS